MSKTKEMFEQIKNELFETKDQVFEGELSNLDGLIKMRKAKKEAENILEIVKDFENERLYEIATEAEANGGKYHGYEIKQVSGRELFSFKNVPQIVELDSNKKTLEDKFKTAFKGVIKGVVQTTVIEDITYWIDENGEVQPLPEMNIGKSFLTVKEPK